MGPAWPFFLLLCLSSHLLYCPISISVMASATWPSGWLAGLSSFCFQGRKCSSSHWLGRKKEYMDWKRKSPAPHLTKAFFVSSSLSRLLPSEQEERKGKKGWLLQFYKSPAAAEHVKQIILRPNLRIGSSFATCCSWCRTNDAVRGGLHWEKWGLSCQLQKFISWPGPWWLSDLAGY